MAFPSPADDYIERSLDLNELLIKSPSSTFFMRAVGDSMKEAGIFNDDLLIVDRSCSPISQNIIVAIFNSAFIVRRFVKEKNQLMLFAENKLFSPIKITAEIDFEIWGVVTYVIHKVK